MDKRIPNSKIREVWLDSSLTSAQAAALVGLSRVHLWVRAKALGLPARPEGRRRVIPEAELRLMWGANLRVRDIADHYGCPQASVMQAARNLGLPRRPKGKHPTVSMAQFREILIGRSIVRQVKKDRVALQQRAGASAE